MHDTVTLAGPRPDTPAGGDPRRPQTRLAALMDPESVVLMGEPDDSGVLAAVGRIDGMRVIAFCTDATVMGGALGYAGAQRIVEAIEVAVRDRFPVVGIWHSVGSRRADGCDSMDGVGRMFAAMPRASGRVPQISVVVGPAAGAAAYGPALTDVVILAESGFIFVTGPDVVRSVTGEDVDMAGLGGVGAHSVKSGVAHVSVPDEAAAYACARRLTGFCTRPCVLDLVAAADTGDPGDGSGPGTARDPSTHRPASRRRAYDVRPVLKSFLDTGEASFLELQPRWAPNIVTALARLGGRAIGVIANNPLRKGGCLDSLSAEKAARFVRLCDAFGIPLVVVTDVPGYLPGTGQEWGGVVRRGAKLLHAFAEAVVPRVTLVTRKSYGGAYIAMNSRSLGATAVFAWPDAETAVMGAEAAVKVLKRKLLAAAPDSERAHLLAKLVAEHEQASGGVRRALDLGLVDEVIEPAATRLRLAQSIAGAPGGRGHHGNIPL